MPGPSLRSTPAELTASVVIATRDRHDDLHRCLGALARQSTERSFEVVVVDDASQVPVEPPAIEHLQVRVLRGKGSGPAEARNLGVAASVARVVLFTDDDVVPEHTWVDSACSTLDAMPSAVAVEGPIATLPWDPLREYSVASDAPGAYLTCNIAYRRDVLSTLGAFYEGWPTKAACEDLDLAYRALRLGPIAFAADMKVLHFPRALTLGGLIGRARHAESDAVLFRRHPDRFPTQLALVAVLELRYVLARWTRVLVAEPARLARDPRAFARLVLIAAGQVAVTVPAVVRGWRSFAMRATT